jgi:hypothetical protein
MKQITLKKVTQKSGGYSSNLQPKLLLLFSPGYKALVFDFILGTNIPIRRL